MKSTIHELGQYFTTCEILLDKVKEFIKNKPKTILEPSLGKGHIINHLQKDKSFKKTSFDCFEIDDSLELLNTLNMKKLNITYADFVDAPIEKTYDTIIGNPPYIKQKSGNIYLKFIEKCVDLLNEDGELIFIVPSDFLKLTSSKDIINNMMIYGTFTHMFLPYNEKLFENASIDVMIFRYQKSATNTSKIILNDEEKFIDNTNGMITINDKETDPNSYDILSNHFDVFVGMVTGKEEVFKNEDFGNISMLNGECNESKYILLDTFPSDDDDLNNYMLENKSQLLSRRIRNFTEKNWFTWGALRNKKVMDEKKGQPCIYVHNMTRQKNVAFQGNVQYFGGSLLMILPKNPEKALQPIVDYLNSPEFQSNFIYSGRFRIGHQQLKNVHLPTHLLI
jgi:adenine-specific DNA-methyltransferase